MVEKEIEFFVDKNGKEVEFFVGFQTTFIVTVKEDGVAKDISAWIDTGKEIHFIARQYPGASGSLWDKTATWPSGGDGTDGRFQVIVLKTDTTTAYDRIVVEFYRIESTIPIHMFDDTQWYSRVLTSNYVP